MGWEAGRLCRRILAATMLVLGMSGNGVVWAGLCTVSETDQIACLETGRARDGEDCEEEMALECLSCEFATNYYSLNRWAGPASAQILRSHRESPNRDRLERALLPLLDARDESPTARRLGYHAARVLACHGVGHLGDHDIFEIVTSVARPPFPSLASLADPRTTDFLAERYAELRDVGTRRPDWPEQRRWLTSVVNCLYHVPGEAAVALAEAIARSESSAEIVERARRVIERPPMPAAPGPAESPVPVRSPEE